MIGEVKMIFAVGQKGEPMNDLISRQAAIEAICTQGTSAERDGQYVISLATAKQRAVDILESLPTIAPVKRGRWIKNQRKSIFHIEPVYICSCCREQEALGEMELSNYCPNCGARMRGEEDERSD